LEAHEIIQIAAFIPDYQSGAGHSVKIYYRDGSIHWLQCSFRSFIKNLAKTFAVNLQEARRRYGPVIGSKNLIPLVLTPFLLFVPLKARKPLVPGDPAYGYFRLRSVQDVISSPPSCLLLLEGGHKLPIIQSYRATCSHLRKARKLEAYLLEQYIQLMDHEANVELMQKTMSKDRQ